MHTIKVEDTEGIATMHFISEGEGQYRMELRDAAGNPVPYVPADERASRKLRAFTMIRHDLEKSRRMLTKAIQQDNNEIKELMWHSAVTSYGRCFVEAKGRGTTLEIAHVKEAGDKHLAVHNKLMEFRHQYVAHSGTNNEQHAIVLIPLDNGLVNPVVERTVTFMSHRISPTNKELEEFISLIQDLKKVVEKLGSKAKRSLVKYYASKSPKQIREIFGKDK
jgi:hypothetical protein